MTIKSEQYIAQAIVQLLALKMRAGSSLSDTRSFVEACLNEANKSALRLTPPIGLGIHGLASILRCWHTKPEYLTPEGLPRALKRSGTSSLRTLIALFYADEKSALVVQRLVDGKLIRRVGKSHWLPTRKDARISQMTDETLQHLAEGIARFVDTVTGNVTATQEGRVLFERACKVPRLPTSEMPAFRRFVGEQAIAFLTSVDDWLEARQLEAKRPRRPAITAGVYTFAFVDKPSRAPPRR